VRSNASRDSEAKFQAANVQYLVDTARASAKNGARRFIYISSIGVLGEETAYGQPFTQSSPTSPCGQYSQSKLDGEIQLRKVAEETGLEYVIIRPPLVYGAGAKGNFAAMVKWLHYGIPLPLGSIDNRRSFIGIDNLIDLILKTVDHPAAANNCFLAADGEDVSTPDFIRRTARAMGKDARLFGFPQHILEAAFQYTGRSQWSRRLISSLQVDISYTCETLQWAPPFTIESGLRDAVREPQ
jgi:nucleoside-diphosphate-sugar epimerase